MLEYWRWGNGKFNRITKEQYFDNRFNEEQYIKLVHKNPVKINVISSEIEVLDG